MNNEPKKTNALCIAGLVCSFLIAPLGLILSIVGVVQVKKNNEDGKALGIAGIIIGALGTLFQIIALVFTIFAFVSFANDTIRRQLLLYVINTRGKNNKNDLLRKFLNKWR